MEKKNFLLVITIIDDIISGLEVVQKSVSRHFLKQYYLRCHHAKKKSMRKTWTIFLHIHCTKKGNLAVVLTSIKCYLTLLWQCSCLVLIFWKIHLQKLAAKSQKHVLVKISSTEISYSIYNIYNRYLTNDVQSMLRERG